MSVYRYLTLKENEVRFLKTLPGQDDDPIICDIEQSTSPQNLNTRLCLMNGELRTSCVESKPMDLKTVFFFTTRSLYNALRNLRSQIKSRTIWADGVFINQQDKEERSRQVLFMSEVYKLAGCVMVYGRDESTHMRTGIQLIRKLWPFVDSRSMGVDIDLYYSEESRLQELGFPTADDPA
ncbi:hypothetical protein BBP40_006409 [Aspergillus hancockii]|nr:hypothetical protein BBP40_006409 [Aspergillus hancockii]